MTCFLVTYTLRNGVRGVLHVISSSSCSAIVTAIDTFGDLLRKCSAKPL